MTIRKTLKIVGILLVMFSMVCLSLPIFSTNIINGETWNIVVNGYNMVEFSPWGSMVLIVPFLLIGLIMSKLKDSIKTIGILGMLMLDCFALTSAYSDTYKWVLQEATGYVRPHMNQLFYILTFFLSCVCFYIECNYFSDGNKMKIENVFLKDEKTKVEPIDYRIEKFYLCNRAYNSAKYNENGEVVSGKSNICFATNEGYFAALNDNDTDEYFNVEALGKDGAVGFMIGNMPTGIYGRFYEDYEFRTNINIKIKEYPNISKGEVELWVLADNGEFIRDDAYIEAISIDNIRLKLLNNTVGEAKIGSAVIQDGKLVAIVTEFDEEVQEYKCIIAELMAIDLCRKIYEHRVLEAMREYEIRKKE